MAWINKADLEELHSRCTDLLMDKARLETKVESLEAQLVYFQELLEERLFPGAPEHIQSPSTMVQKPSAQDRTLGRTGIKPLRVRKAEFEAQHRTRAGKADLNVAAMLSTATQEKQ